MSRTETAKETIDQMVEEPTLDEFFKKNPKHFTDEDYKQMVRVAREQRARFVKKKEAKR